VPVQRPPQRMFSTVNNMNRPLNLTNGELAIKKAHERRLGRLPVRPLPYRQIIKGVRAPKPNIRRSPRRSVGKMRPKGRRSPMNATGRR